MSITFTGSDNGSNKTSGTSITSNAPGGIAVGSFIMAAIVWDGAPTARTCKDSLTGLHFQAAEILTKTDPGGNILAVYAGPITDATLWTALTFAWTGSVTAKAYHINIFSGMPGSSTVNSSTSNGTTSSGISLAAAGTPSSGNMLWGVWGRNAPNDEGTFTGDADTSNGTWHSRLASGTTGGGAASNVVLQSQWKELTGTGAQTYDPALTSGSSRDWQAAVVEFGVSGAARSVAADFSSFFPV